MSQCEKISSDEHKIELKINGNERIVSDKYITCFKTNSKIVNSEKNSEKNQEKSDQFEGKKIGQRLDIKYSCTLSNLVFQQKNTIEITLHDDTKNDPKIIKKCSKFTFQENQNSASKMTRIQQKAPEFYSTLVIKGSTKLYKCNSLIINHPYLKVIIRDALIKIDYLQIISKTIYLGKCKIRYNLCYLRSEMRLFGHNIQTGISISDTSLVPIQDEA